MTSETSIFINEMIAHWSNGPSITNYGQSQATAELSHWSKSKRSAVIGRNFDGGDCSTNEQSFLLLTISDVMNRHLLPPTPSYFHLKPPYIF